MSLTHLVGRILTPEGWVHGRIAFDQNIWRIESDDAGKNNLHVLPGFIDVHVHGGAGHDTMDGENGVRGLAEFHARHGTTSLYATTITNPRENIFAALQGVAKAMHQPAPNAANVLGAHLEGPFISAKKLGAQPAFSCLPKPERVQEILASNVVRLLTLAPELDGASQAALLLAKADVRVGFGHTMASAEIANAVMRAILDAGGVVGTTHLFNAMTGFTGREPGVIGAALANPKVFAEIILDGHHVDATSFLAVLAAKPNRLMLVTDAIRAAGLGNGDYDLGGQTVHVKNGVARLANGSLAGSVLTMIEALRNAVKLGLSLEQASQLASQNPANYMGLASKGKLRVGNDADLVVLDNDLNIVQVFVAGQEMAL